MPPQLMRHGYCPIFKFPLVACGEVARESFTGLCISFSEWQRSFRRDGLLSRMSFWRRTIFSCKNGVRVKGNCCAPTFGFAEERETTNYPALVLRHDFKFVLFFHFGQSAFRGT